MEYVEKSKEEIISEFIVGTCQLLPELYDAVSEPFHSGSGYVIPCGSTMEFYIRPLHKCINDVDALFLRGDRLAFADDFPVLPNEVSLLHDTIKCYRIEPYLKYPGFVRLRLWGEMNYSWKYKEYKFTHTTDIRPMYTKIVRIAKAARRQITLKSFGEQPHTMRGPAVTIQLNALSASNDGVISLWCPQWPKEAQRWLKRPRSHGWPMIATISEVVQHGCHVVYAQHRACRDEEAQWRFSFSVAEVILLQSWTQTQQIVYHLLRFFSEKKLIKKDCSKEDEVLCTYHLKTLMLWTCEEMSPEWWNSFSVIAICCELLKKLSELLKRGYCPNYFIPEANLFHESFRLTMLDKTVRKLNKFCKSGILCCWFLENYIVPSIPTRTDVEDIVSVAKYLSSLTEKRKTLQSEFLDLLFSKESIHCNIYTRKSINSQTIQPKSILSQMCALRKFTLLVDNRMSKLQIPVDVSCFTYFDKTVYCLNTAYSLGYGEIYLDGELFEYVKGIFLKPKIVRCQYRIFPELLSAEKSQCQFLRAQDLMENLTVSSSPSEFQLLSLMSKEFLRKTIECDDSQSNSIAPAALVYLAAIHFASSENQMVIDLCSTVLMCETTEIENETLNAGCLLFIGDVARIVGFCVTWKMFNENVHHNMRKIYLDLRLTPKVFAHYLAAMSAERISKQLELNPVLHTSAFPLDQYFLAFAKRKSDILMNTCTCFKTARQCVYRRTDYVIRQGTLCVDTLIAKENLIDYLTENALENMTSFYSVIRKDFGIQCNTIDCYRALYLYKCRQYGEVLHLCEQILKESDLQSDLKEFAFANVLVMTPLDSFFDRDIQSLIGLHTLFFLSPLNDDLRKFKLGVLFFHQAVHTNSLMKHYNVTSFHFIGRHFLARYLKLRCYIDCNLPCAEALIEFAAVKCDFPFEQFIHRFILQRHCKFQ